MAERRAIASALFNDEWFGPLPHFEQVLWIGLFARCADDQGRFIINSVVVRAHVFPYQDVPIVQVDEALESFALAHKLIVYEAAGKRIAQIAQWWSHQHMKFAMPSHLPAPKGWKDSFKYTVGKTCHTQNWPPAQPPSYRPCGEPVQDAGTDDEHGEPVQDAGTGRQEKEKEKEKVKTPLPPKVVEKPKVKSGDDPKGKALASLGKEPAPSLESLRNLPLCAKGECPVRTLRIGQRGVLSKIVGEEIVGEMYAESAPLHRTLAGMAGYICAACWKASAAPGVTMADRQPLCRRALVAYVDSLYAFHREKPIRSLPAFLRTRYGNMTEAPVSDALLAELRALERAPGERQGEVRIGECLPDVRGEVA